MRVSYEGSPKRRTLVGKASEADELRHGASALGVDLSRDQLFQLQRYAELVCRWNKKFNLVSRQDIGRFVARHLLDSLTVAALLRPPNVLDLGTGAGLPGIPLAVVCPELQVVLLDRGARKARFLRQVVLHTGLANVTVRCQDAREVMDVGPFATIVTRAVTNASNLWGIAEPLLSDDGVVLMMHRTESTAAPLASRHPVASVSGATLNSCWVEVPGVEGQHEILSMRRSRA